MKLFGRRKSDNVQMAGNGVLFGQPAPNVPQRRASDTLETIPAYVEPSGMELDDPFGYDTMSREQLIEENRALRSELSGLKSRIAYVKTVLLSDAVVAGETARPAPVAAPAAAPGPDVRQMLAELKNDIAAMNAQSAAAVPQPAPAMMARAPAQARPHDDLRAMLAELKGDIAAMKSAPAPVISPVQAVAPAAPSDDLRAMLAELKGDIESIKAAPVPAVAKPASPARPASADDDLRAMLAELKGDIESIKAAPRQAAPAGPSDDLRAMLAELKGDIESLKKEGAPAGKPAASGADDEVAGMLKALKADIEALKSEKKKARPEPAAAGEEDVRAMLRKLQSDIGELKKQTAREEEPIPAVGRVSDLLSRLQDELGKAVNKDKTGAESAPDADKDANERMAGGSIH